MSRTILVLALCLAFFACTPFFYGGVVVLGPAKDQAPAEGSGD